MKEVIQFGNELLGIKSTKRSTGNEAIDLLYQYSTHLKEKRLEGSPRLLTALEKGFPAVVSQEHLNIAHRVAVYAR